MSKLQFRSLSFQALEGILALSALTLGACGSTTTKVVTVPAPDTTAPLVLSSTPAAGAVGVAVNSQVNTIFSKTMNVATLTPSTFALSGPAGAVAGAVSVSGDARSATFTPAAPLAFNTIYTASVATGAQDTIGNALTASTWKFTTGAAPDTTPPTLSSVSPAVGSIGNQASTAILRATLSKPVDCARVTDSSLQVFELGLRVPGYVSCAGATIRFNPFQSLPTNTNLQTFLEPTVPDLSGNRLGIPYAWSFAMAPWTRQMGTTAEDSAQGVATDAAGNVYVAGYTTGGLDGNVNAGGIDLFVVKYDATGAKQWTRQMGTPSNDLANGVATDAAGNVYVAGATYGGLDGNVNAGGTDLFVVKYDAAGAKQWTRQMGTADARGVATDAAGNVYVAGRTIGGLDGNVNAGGSDLFVVKYDATGVKQWTRQMGTPSFDGAQGVATDAAGNVYVAGFTLGGGLDGNVNAGGSDLFVVKYQQDGRRR